MANTNLHTAKSIKDDEFYTQLEDIEDELGHYIDKFHNKVILCNCDDPTKSNFWKYFHINFERLGLKKLISTHFEIANTHSYKIEYTGGNDHDIMAGTVTQLNGNGDFRSSECVELIKSCDIVVTNPPFSLFREYITFLMKYDKKFIILGNMNAITYKEVFPFIQDDKIWLGCRSLSKDMYFNVPENKKAWLVKNKKEGSAYKIINGVVMGRLASCCWFTNLNHSKKHELIKLTRQYNSNLYPKYDNCNAIEVSKTVDIPIDYDGVMGVPITFLDKYNPEQFEIVRFRKGDDGKDLCVNGKCPYFRILIKRRVDKHLIN